MERDLLCELTFESENFNDGIKSTRYRYEFCRVVCYRVTVSYILAKIMCSYVLSVYVSCKLLAYTTYSAFSAVRIGMQDRS